MTDSETTSKIKVMSRSALFPLLFMSAVIDIQKLCVKSLADNIFQTTKTTALINTILESSSKGLQRSRIKTTLKMSQIPPLLFSLCIQTKLLSCNTGSPGIQF